MGQSHSKNREEKEKKELFETTARLERQRDEELLHAEGRINVRTGMHTAIRYQKKFSLFSAFFQLNRKLYVCGGVKFTNLSSEYLSELFSLDYSGKSVELYPMRRER